MNLPQGFRAGFTPLTRENDNLPQPALNLPQGRSQPALIPAPPVRRAGSRGQVPHKKFAANTCPNCHHTTIAGITDHGFTLHLEPLQLTDLDEARAIGDQVPTYNLYPDRLVRLRWLTHIRHPATVARHARHTCDTTYGTLIPPAPAKSAPLPDSPPF